MSIASEIARITGNRNTIRNKMVNLGLAEAGANLADLATAISGIENRGAPNAQVTEGDSYTIEPGYYTGGTVQGVSGGGNYQLQAKSVSPTKSQQSVSPDAGYYGLSSVNVGAIPAAYQDVTGVTATANDVLATKVIVTSTGQSVTGKIANNGTLAGTIDGLSSMTYNLAAGYYAGGKVTLTNDIEDALAEI